MECQKCNKFFSRVDNLKRHQRQSCQEKRRKLDSGESSKTIKCDICELNIQKNVFAAHLRCGAHKAKAFVVMDDGVEQIAQAFGNRIVSYKITAYKDMVDLKEFMDCIKEKVLTLVQQNIGIHHLIKLNVETFAIYYLERKENLEIKSFNTKNRIAGPSTNLYEVYDAFMEEMDSKMADFQERDSGKTG